MDLHVSTLKRRRGPGPTRPRSTSGILTAIAAVLMVVLGLVGAPTGAVAATSAQTDDQITWSVRPTPTSAEPERPNFSFAVKGGDTVKDSIRVRNISPTVLKLKIYASDALNTASGALDLLRAGEKAKDVGAWTTLDKSALELPVAGFVDVPFTMKVPPKGSVESGDHTGGIVTSLVSDGVGADGQPVVLDRRLGTRIQVRMEGPLHPALTVTDFKTSYNGPKNPVGGGTMHLTYTVNNTGNVRMAADQNLALNGLFGLGGRSPSVDPMPELLPGNSITLHQDISGVLPALRTSSKVKLSPVATRAGDTFPDGTAAPTASTSNWTLPWALLLLVLVLVGAFLGRKQMVARRKAHEERLVRDALAAKNLTGSRG
jgi:hypothetical protein